MSFFNTTTLLPLLVVLSSLSSSCMGSRKLMELYQPEPNLLTYHNGQILQGHIAISILWYGKFTDTQKSIISDFIISLTTNGPQQKTSSVSQWWSNIDNLYLSQKKSTIQLSNQDYDQNYSLGKSLSMEQISQLASKTNPKNGGIAVVFTAEDVEVEGFCISHCATHGSNSNSKSTFIWVGNSETQCPGQCAWPFHQPVYGPQNPPLTPPNGDIGIDGMVMNLASMIAGTVTNPFSDGFYQGDKEAPLEACTACPGVYGPGAFPGYAGLLVVDPATGASYNAKGVNGREYLLPAVFNPSTSTCSTLV